MDKDSRSAQDRHFQRRLKAAAEGVHLPTEVELLRGMPFFNEDMASDVREYLFVNARNAEYLGECLKMSNVKKAYDRACVRAGIEPHSLGASLHGFRHYYAWYAKHVLHLDEETVQRMLRQKSPLSQRTYGKRPSDVRDAMDQFAKGRRLEA